eukprot:symbB.v1.2.034561.t1/scaffold4485.1/size39082/3
MSEVYIKEPATKGKAVLTTTHGDLEIELWATETPKACRNFCQLILEGYYNGTTFHRIIRDFLVQGGDATGTGDGCESIYGGPYPDEIHPRLKFRYRGMMGIASAGRGTKTNGSQFFIAMGRLPSLDGKHTLFGKVVGQTVYNLVRLNEVEVDKNDIPVDAPRIVRAELQSVPKQIKGKEEHRRAPVHKKNVLSFAGAGSDEEEEENEPEGNVKVKSAHDVLNDPRLSRDVAYPEEVAEKKKLREGKRPAAANGGDAKRPVPASRKEEEKEREQEDSEEPDFGASDSDASVQKAKPKKDKEALRQETILKLKRDIVGLNNGLPTDEPSRKKSGATRSCCHWDVTAAAAQLCRLSPGGHEKGVQAAGRNQSRSSRKGSKAAASRGIVSGTQGLPDDPEDGEEQNEKEAEPGTLASYWEEGDEETDKDWLGGSGLKFHTSGDKAFEIAARKARDSLEIFDPIAATGNSEALAAARKRRNDKIVPSMRRQQPLEKW